MNKKSLCSRSATFILSHLERSVNRRDESPHGSLKAFRLRLLKVLFYLNFSFILLLQSDTTSISGQNNLYKHYATIRLRLLFVQT